MTNEQIIILTLCLVFLATLVIAFLLWQTLKTQKGLLDKTNYETMQENFTRRFQEYTENILEKNSREYFHQIKEQFFAFQEKWLKEQHELKHGIKEGQKSEFIQLQSFLNQQMLKMTEKVNDNLTDSLKHTTDTFQQIMKRLVRIDEAQKQIEHLSQNVVSLQEVLTDKKTRGIFGEVQLNHLLASVFGDKSSKTYQLQYTLSTKSVVDSILFLPDPVGNLCIDAKFPLENYRKLRSIVEVGEDPNEVLKLFRKDIKKHIDDIASKYIIPDETSDQAMMFLPAEAIFAELHAYHPELIEYAHKKRVWITGPSTFMAILTTIQVVLNNIEQTKHAHLIQAELKKLAQDFTRYRKRWDNLVRHIDTVSKDVKEISTSTDRITKKFDKIAEVKIEKDELRSPSGPSMMI